MYYIVIRESQQNDMPFISELVRKAYLSNVSKAFVAALFNEVSVNEDLCKLLMKVVVGNVSSYCFISSLYVYFYGSSSSVLLVFNTDSFDYAVHFNLWHYFNESSRINT